MAQLLTLTDVLTYSPAGSGFPQKPILEHLDMVEEEIVLDCLGDDLFAFLVDNLADTSAALDWEDCGDYALDELVIRNGVVYKSTANQNNTDPAVKGSDWERVQKFDNECCNSLWDRYLRKILTYRVYYYALPFATIVSGAGGLKVQSIDSRGERAATPSEIGSTQRDVERVISTTTVNMKRWLSDTEQAECNFPGTSTESCDGCEPQPTNSRFFW